MIFACGKLRLIMFSVGKKRATSPSADRRIMQIFSGFILKLSQPNSYLMSNYTHLRNNTLMKNRYNFAKLLQINFTVSLALGALFLTFNDGYKPSDLITTAIGLFATIGGFYLIFWLFTLVFIAFKKVRYIFAAGLFALFNLLLIIDFFIFRLYHTHINAMVLDIAFSPAALRNVDLGVYPYIAAVLLVAFFVGLQYLITTKVTHEIFATKRFLTTLILIVVFDKLMFGVANLYSYTDITEKMRVIPYYQPTSINRFAKNNLGIEPAPKAISMTSKKGARINYPLNEILYKDSFINDNILIVMMDAVRWNMVDEESAPNMHKLLKESIYFENHFSGGNATRFGVFSFFYGLNAPYWFSFLDEQKSAVLFDALDYRGFDTRIFASSDLNWPEFRRTVFAKINDRIIDNLEGSAWQKDRELNNIVLDYLAKPKNSPFFAYVFFDAPHQASYPPSHAKFKPDNEGDKNYLTVNASKRDVLFNQYKNSIYYDDMLIGELIEKLKELNIYEKTRIIITADHGEEFFESGGYGHNGSFSQEQTKPIFFMRIPNEKPRVVTNITSHIDMVPTIMNWLGVANDPKDYSLGSDLMDENYKREYAIIGNWNHNAIVEGGNTLVFSAHPDPVSGTKVFDTVSYKRLDPALSKNHAKTILEVMDENRRFYK